MKGSPDKVDFVIIGIGININQRAAEFDDAIKHLATSLRIETGSLHSRVEILKKVLARLGELYYRLCQLGFTPLKEQWLAASGMLGKRVVVDFKGALLAGRVVDMSQDGALVCQKDAGEIVEISAGDATIVKE